MYAESPLCHDHPTGTAREKIIKYLNPKTRDSYIKPQQQSHNLSIIQLLSVHTGYSGAHVGSAPVAFKGPCGRDNATVATLKQLTEELLFQSWTVS